MNCQPDTELAVAGDRCTGECCTEFDLPWNHDEHSEYLRGERSLHDSYRESAHNEVSMILAMVLPLPSVGPYMYTCRLFDGKNCTAYASRPVMCSEFPYGRRCTKGKKCAWDAGRKGQHGRRLTGRVHLTILGAGS